MSSHFTGDDERFAEWMRQADSQGQDREYDA